MTIPPLYYAAYRIGSWELHHDATLVNPAAAERFSSELSRLLFWIHQASGPIAIGVLTIAVASAVFGYVGAVAGLAILVAEPLAAAPPRATTEDSAVRSRGPAVVDCGWRRSWLIYPG